MLAQLRRPLDGFDNHLSERRTVNRERRTLNTGREKRIDDCVPQPILAVLVSEPSPGLHRYRAGRSQEA